MIHIISVNIFIRLENYYNNNSSNTTQLIYLNWRFDLNQRPSSEEAGTGILPVLDTTERCRVKKVVVGMTELIAALVLIHSVLAFLADMYCLFDPPGKSYRLPVDHHRFGPVDHMVLLSRVVGEGGLRSILGD